MSQEILDIGRAFLDTPAGEGILKKLSGFKGTVDEFKKTKAELIDKYDILVQAYDIKGSVANQQTSQPEPGVQVQLFFGLYPIKKEEFTKTVITQQVQYDENENPIIRRNGQPKTKRVREKVQAVRWVLDDSKSKELKTDKDGRYEMKIGLPILREKTMKMH